MASIAFYNTADGAYIANSGIGFYGAAGFATPVPVGSYQENIYVTDSGGTIQGPECNTVKYAHANSGYLNNNATPINLRTIPNYQSTINARFTHASAVAVQNVKARIYNRSNIDSGATNVTTRFAEINHTGLVQENTGLGNEAWYLPVGSALVVTLSPSPGLSGVNNTAGSGSTASGTRHDWYFVISASPDTVGSKYFALYMELEYL